MRKKSMKWIALLAASAMAAGTLAGCGNQSTADTAQTQTTAEASQGESAEESAAGTENTADTGEKPELKVMFYSQPYDMNAEPLKAVMEDLSGYQITYYNLPSENANEKLMLEVASGADYDMYYRMDSDAFSQLKDKNALIDLKPLLEEYGQDILANVNDIAWSAVTDEEGRILGIPLDTADPSSKTYSGTITGGIAFRSDTLEELGYEIPTTLDEFYEVCKAYTDKTGNPALTVSKNGWLTDIMSAFGMGSTSWYNVDGVQTPRVKMEGFKDYVAFMQKLYQEGILDNDMPINAAENCKEKFTSNTALCMQLAFWDIPSMVEAMAVSNPDAKAVFAVCLAKDENTPGFLSTNLGVSEISVITKTSKNPEDAVKWYNEISKPDNFKRIYIGEENVSYEVKDGQYYPIFPAFDEYVNSDKFTGSVNYAERNAEWEARARKTPEMAEAYEQMNEHLDEYDFYLSCEGFVSDPALTEYMPSLNTAIGDLLIQGIAEGNDAQAVVDEIIQTWEREGGLECEAAMQKWYDEHQELLNN